MIKNAKEHFTKMKGDGNETKVLTGKGTFSQTAFANTWSALVNDPTHKVKTVDKEGKEVLVSVRDLVLSDIKKTAANAKYPQKSEVGVYDNTDIAVSGIAEASRHVMLAHMQCGKKVTLPAQKDMVGEVYLQSVPGRVKTSQVRNMKTRQVEGTSTSTTKDHVQVRAKSSAPKHLVTKIRKDNNGNVVHSPK